MWGFARIFEELVYLAAFLLYWTIRAVALVLRALAGLALIVWSAIGLFYSRWDRRQDFRHHVAALAEYYSEHPADHGKAVTTVWRDPVTNERFRLRYADREAVEKGNLEITDAD